MHILNYLFEFYKRRKKNPVLLIYSVGFFSSSFFFKRVKEMGRSREKIKNQYRILKPKINIELIINSLFKKKQQNNQFYSI